MTAATMTRDAAPERQRRSPTARRFGNWWRPSSSRSARIDQMLQLRVHRLFVIDDDGVLVGVTTDVMRRLLDW